MSRNSSRRTSVLAAAAALFLAGAPDAQERRAEHVDLPAGEQWATWKQVGALYAGQWGYYVVGQREALAEHGSLRNWIRHPVDPHFDKDFYDFNLVLHTLTGSLYYGYYRAFGSSARRSLALSTVSVLLFEFTVETATERPSYQDIYQTPVLGAVVAMGMEELSMVLVESPHAPVRALARVLNPFLLVPGASWRVHLEPALTTHGPGGRLAVSFP